MEPTDSSGIQAIAEQAVVLAENVSASARSAYEELPYPASKSLKLLAESVVILRNTLPVNSEEPGPVLEWTERVAQQVRGVAGVFDSAPLDIPPSVADALNNAAQAAKQLLMNLEQISVPLALGVDAEGLGAAPKAPMNLEEQLGNASSKLIELEGRIAEKGKEIDGDIETLRRSLSSLGGEISARLEAADQLTEDARDKIEARNDEIDSVVGALTGRALNGDYQRLADDESRNSRQYRRVALLLMAGMVGVTTISFLVSLEGPVAWSAFALRFSLVFVISVPAAYCARQSAIHRNRQLELEKTALQLASLNPFIAPLDEEQRNTVRLRMAEHVFSASVENSPATRRADPSELLPVTDLLAKIGTVARPD